MKAKLFAIGFVVSLALLAHARADEAVPFETLREIADRNAESMWGYVSPGGVFEYHSFQGGIVAYAFNYKIGAAFPAREEVLRSSEVARQTGDKNVQWGADEYAYMVMSARTSGPPFLCYGKRLTPEYAYGAQIEAKARERGHKWICDWGCGYTAPSAEAGTYTTECGYVDYPRCRNCGGN